MPVFQAKLHGLGPRGVGQIALRLLTVLLVFGMMFAAVGGTLRVWLEQEEGSLLVDEKKHKPLRAMPQRTARRLAQAWAAASGAWLQWAVPNLVGPVAAYRSFGEPAAIRAGSGTPLRC